MVGNAPVQVALDIPRDVGQLDHLADHQGVFAGIGIEVAITDLLQHEQHRIADHVPAVAGQLLFIQQHTTLGIESVPRPDHALGHRMDQTRDPFPGSRVQVTVDRIDQLDPVDEDPVDPLAVGLRSAPRKGGRGVRGVRLEAIREVDQCGRGSRWLGDEVLVGIEGPAVEVGDCGGPGIGFGKDDDAGGEAPGRVGEDCPEEGLGIGLGGKRTQVRPRPVREHSVDQPDRRSEARRNAPRATRRAPPHPAKVAAKRRFRKRFPGGEAIGPGFSCPRGTPGRVRPSRIRGPGGPGPRSLPEGRPGWRRVPRTRPGPPPDRRASRR